MLKIPSQLDVFEPKKSFRISHKGGADGFERFAADGGDFGDDVYDRERVVTRAASAIGGRDVGRIGF